MLLAIPVALAPNRIDFTVTYYVLVIFFSFYKLKTVSVYSFFFYIIFFW